MPLNDLISNRSPNPKAASVSSPTSAAARATRRPWRQKQAGLQAWRNRVAQKSIDFVVCDVATLRPLVAIELDEPSHAQPDRQTRDEVVHAMLTAAGLPWVCVLTSRTYDTRELESALAAYLPAGGE